jgi:hypothetical protein
MELVNGYQCRNCTDVDYAKRNIDPAHPKDGPFGINKTDGVERGPAVLLSGALAPTAGVPGVSAVNAVGSASAVSPVPPVKPVVYRPGAAVDVSV